MNRFVFFSGSVKIFIVNDLRPIYIYFIHSPFTSVAALNELFTHTLTLTVIIKLRLMNYQILRLCIAGAVHILPVRIYLQEQTIRVRQNTKKYIKYFKYDKYLKFKYFKSISKYFFYVVFPTSISNMKSIFLSKKYFTACLKYFPCLPRNQIKMHAVQVHCSRQLYFRLKKTPTWCEPKKIFYYWLKWKKYEFNSNKLSKATQRSSTPNLMQSFATCVQCFFLFCFVLDGFISF